MMLECTEGMLRNLGSDVGNIQKECSGKWNNLGNMQKEC